MCCFILSCLFSTLISLVSIGRLSEQEKDLEILLLRHQLAILERKLDKPVKPNRAEKLTLAVLTARLRLVTRRSVSAPAQADRFTPTGVGTMKIRGDAFLLYRFTPTGSTAVNREGKIFATN